VIADRIRIHPRTARKASSAALMIVAVLALYNWVLSPHLGYLHAMQRLESAVDRVTEERDTICGSLDTKVSQWRALQQQRAEIDEGLFTADEAKAFRRGLLPLVEETGCRVILVDFAGSGKTERIGEPNAPVVIAVSHLNLGASGQSDQIAALLERLGNSRPKVWIDSCQLDFANGYSGRIDCDLVLTTHVVSNQK
jgi:hypothetical protein